MREYHLISSHNAEVSTTDPAAAGEADLANYIHAGNRELSAILQLHASTDTTTDVTVTVTMQESDTTASSDYSAITGAAFTAAVPSSDMPFNQQIFFQASSRYVRTRALLVGSTIKVGITSAILAIAKSTTG